MHVVSPGELFAEPSHAPALQPVKVPKNPPPVLDRLTPLVGPEWQIPVYRPPAALSFVTIMIRESLSQLITPPLIALTLGGLSFGFYRPKGNSIYIFFPVPEEG